MCESGRRRSEDVVTLSGRCSQVRSILTFTSYCDLGFVSAVFTTENHHIRKSEPTSPLQACVSSSGRRKLRGGRR